MFVNKMSDSDGETSETQVWLDFVFNCKYISAEVHQSLFSRYESVGAMLGKMIQHPDKFVPRGVNEPT